MSERTRSTTEREAAARGRSQSRPLIEPESRLSVRDALALEVGKGRHEVYVGWANDPVCVASRRHFGRNQTWEVVGLMLRARVIEAIQPLIGAGWELDGTPTTALRWDTSLGNNGQQYDGCWVKLRSRIA